LEGDSYCTQNARASILCHLILLKRLETMLNAQEKIIVEHRQTAPKKILATTNRSEENLMRTQPSRQVGCNALLGEKVVSWGMISSPEYHKHFNKIEHQKAPLLVP